MLIFKKQIDLKKHLSSFLSHKKSIGFVPTMGALHEGHLSLVKESCKNNDITVVSIFVNPTQFNNPEDLKKYPRTLDKDVKIIESIDENCIIFAPTTEEIYGQVAKTESFIYDGLENQMEGKKRPGHFDGVGTIVKRLFEIVTPNNAYFGEKDFQQLQIVKKLVEKHHFPVNIIGCPILREKNGLAMSSRNERLTDYERQKARFIFETLQKSKVLFKTKSALEVKKWVENHFQKNPLFELEYIEIADEENLLPCIRKNKSKKYRAFIAVFVNSVRLIDTISLN